MTGMDWPRLTETGAILSNVLGVVLLFIYGMPYRVASPGGRQALGWAMRKEPDPETVRLDNLHRRRGFVGLSLVLASIAVLVALLWI